MYNAEICWCSGNDNTRMSKYEESKQRWLLSCLLRRGNSILSEASPPVRKLADTRSEPLCRPALPTCKMVRLVPAIRPFSPSYLSGHFSKQAIVAGGRGWTGWVWDSAEAQLGDGSLSLECCMRRGVVVLKEHTTGPLTATLFHHFFFQIGQKSTL